MEPNKAKTGKVDEKPKKTAGIGPVIFLSIFAVLLAVAAGLLLREVFEARLQAEVALEEKTIALQEKQEIEEQLNELEEEYVELSVKHEHLEGAIRQERARIARLRQEMRGIDPADAQKYKEQIQELEDRLEEYREQVRMLEAENQSLESEKSQMQSTLNQTTARFDELEQRKKELEELVDKASYLTISGITAQGIRERRRGDEPTDRARRTDKLQICWTVNENLVAEPGNREFHVRIIDPNNRVLAASDQNTFDHNGEELVYSLRRQINFRNDQQNVCVVWTQDERFESGYYNVNIYAEGREAGYKLFELD